MNERPVDEHSLQEEALRVVGNLKEVARRHERFFSPDIEAVLVFSGPGTYFSRLKAGEGEGLRWMDRDRIRAGVAVVREVTAANMKSHWGVQVKGHKVSRKDIYLYGPYFVFNGMPEENEDLRKALVSGTIKLPEEKIIIIDEVREDDGSRHPIRHTGDQYKSSFQEITRPVSPIYGVRNVALVAHISDFVRHPFYAQDYNRDLRERGFEGLNFWAYAIKNRLGTEEELIKEELHKLVEYAIKGDLATEPLTFRVSKPDEKLLPQNK